MRHLDLRTALARITVIARYDIHVGEELLVTYVNPDLGLRERRQELRAWGFGICQCTRCIEEGKEREGAGLEGSGIDDLEQELKAGLGLA